MLVSMVTTLFGFGLLRYIIILMFFLSGGGWFWCPDHCFSWNTMKFMIFVVFPLNYMLTVGGWVSLLPKAKAAKLWGRYNVYNPTGRSTYTLPETNSLAPQNGWDWNTLILSFLKLPAWGPIFRAFASFVSGSRIHSRRAMRIIRNDVKSIMKRWSLRRDV